MKRMLTYNEIQTLRVMQKVITQSKRFYDNAVNSDRPMLRLVA
jgi:hypothetical protein